MADRTIAVRLIALVDQYKAGMREAANATKQVATSGASLSKLGPQLANVGDTLTRRVSVPLAAAGVGAVAMGRNFEQAFARMVGLANVASDEVDGLQDAVLSLAGEVGRGPQELAEALYFVRSAGVVAGDGLDVLEVSAKAAAAGLGSTVAVADAVTSAMGAYGEGVLTAAQATDVLVATAREGKVEAADIAPQLGRVLPIAAQLGVSFNELGAAFSFMSKGGGGAELVTTNLTNVLSKLLNPAEEGKKALEQIGITTAQLRREVDENFLGALQHLREKLEENGLELGDFSRDMQFTIGALQLTGDNAAEAADHFGKFTDVTGSTEDAFAAIKGDLLEMSQAWAEFQVALINAGRTLGPIAADILNAISGLASAFSDLPPELQKVVLGFAGLVGVAGPVLSIYGRMATLTGTLTKMGGAGATAARGISLVGRSLRGLLVLGGVIEVMGGIGRAIDRATGSAPVAANISKLSHALVELGQAGVLSAGGAEDAGLSIDALKTAVNELRDTSAADELQHVGEAVTSLGGILGSDDLDNAKQTLGDLDEALANVAAQDLGTAATAFDQIKGALADVGVPAERLVGLFPLYEAALTDTDTAQRLATGSADAMAGALDAVTDIFSDLIGASQLTSEALSETFDPLFGMLDALDANAQAKRDVVRAGRDLADAEREIGKASNVVADAQAELAAALAITADEAQAARDGISDLQDELRGSVDPLFSMVDALEAHEDALRRLRDLQLTPWPDQDIDFADKLQDAERDVARTALDVEQAMVGLVGSIRTGDVSLAQARETLQGWVDDGLITADQAANLAAEFDDVAAKAEALAGSDVDIAITTSVDEAQQKAAADRAEAVADAQDKVTEANERLVDAHDAVVDAQDRLETSQRDVVRSALAVEQAQLDLKDAVRAGKVDIDLARDALRDWVGQGLITQGQATATRLELEKLWAQFQAFNGVVVATVKVDLNFGDLLDRLKEAEKIAPWLEGLSDLFGPLLGSAAGAQAGAAGSFDSGGVVPGRMGSPVRIDAHSGETVLPTHRMGFMAAVAPYVAGGGWGGSNSTSTDNSRSVSVGTLVVQPKGDENHLNTATRKLQRLTF